MVGRGGSQLPRHLDHHLGRGLLNNPAAEEAEHESHGQESEGELASMELEEEVGGEGNLPMEDEGEPPMAGE